MSDFSTYGFKYDKTCRTCLKQEEDVISFTSIFNESITPMEIFNELFIMGLKISKDDGLPQSICNECIDCLLYIFSFRKLCEKSQRKLESSYVAEKLVSIEITNANELEFANVEFLHDDILNEQKLGNEMKEETLAENDVTSSSDEWNQNDFVQSELPIDEIEHNTSQFGSNDIKLMDQNNIVSETGLNTKCNYCNEIFKTIELHDTHTKLIHPLKNKTYICPTCGKGFATAQNRNIHIESHNKNYAYKCDICDSEFKCKSYLAKHKRSIHTVEENECPHCFMKFNNTNKYKYHLKTHDPNKKYKCQYCDKSFLQQHHLSNHERVHTGVRPYLCNICGKDFRQEHNFTLHLRTHNGDRPYVCTLCGKGFAQRGSFILHKRQHAGTRPYQCEHCGKKFYQKSNLNVHLRTHTGERPFKCELCNKSFVQSPQLKYHKISVHGTLTPNHKKQKNILKDDDNVKPTSITERIAVIINPKIHVPAETEPGNVRATSTKHYLFKCSLCVKEFKLPSSLASHMKIHSEERKHVCSDCGNSFKRAEHLRVHINGVHLKQKPYSCEICYKRFSRAGDRNIHILAHTGEKPHSCPHCSKRFRLQKALRAHIRIHTGEKPHKCEICNMGFITYNALVVHTLKHPESLLSLAKESCLNQYTKVV